MKLGVLQRGGGHVDVVESMHLQATANQFGMVKSAVGCGNEAFHAPDCEIDIQLPKSSRETISESVSSIDLYLSIVVAGKAVGIAQRHTGILAGCWSALHDSISCRA